MSLQSHTATSLQFHTTTALEFQTTTSLEFQTTTSLQLHTPTSTAADFPAVESAGAAFFQVAFGFFLALFIIIAMLACCNWTEKHEYTSLGVEESEEEKEGLPVYGEIERVKSKAGESF